MKKISLLLFLFINLISYGLLYGETYYKSVDKNGNVSFSNVPAQNNYQSTINMGKPTPTSKELQEFGGETVERNRLAEENARALRNTPNTRAHQGLTRSLQREKSVIERYPNHPERFTGETVERNRLAEENARALRNTPNTDAHQGLIKSLQREKSVIEGYSYYPER